MAITPLRSDDHLANVCPCMYDASVDPPCGGPPPLEVHLSGAQYERAVEMALACYAEAGYPAGRSTDDPTWVVPAVPHDVAVKARELVYRALEVEWQTHLATP